MSNLNLLDHKKTVKCRCTVKIMCRVIFMFTFSLRIFKVSPGDTRDITVTVNHDKFLNKVI